MPIDKTPLYKEALIEAQTIRELAKKEAEKSILEKFSPIVDQIINKEMSGAPVIFEQEEDLTNTPPIGLPTAAPASATPQMPATAPMDANVILPAGDMGTSSVPPAAVTSGTQSPTNPTLPLPADVSTPPVTNGASLAIPVPGPDGKITVDIEALFAATPEGSEPNFAAASITPVPAATSTPSDLAGEGEAITNPELAGEPKAELPVETAPLPLSEIFQESIDSLEKEVLTEVYSGKQISVLQKDILQNKILSLYEMAQKAKISKGIPRAIIANGEVLMELMFAKLKETPEMNNSYNRQSTIKEAKMTKKDFRTLKEFASSLFKEEIDAKGHAGFGDGDTTKAGITNTTTLKDETPKKKSGSAGGVKDPGKEQALKLGGAAVAEAKDEEEDVMDESASLESELMEMLSDMDEDVGMGATPMSAEEEGVMPMMESSDDEEESELQKESLKRKLKALKEQEAKLVKAIKECGMSGSSMGEPANVNIKISVVGGEVDDVETDTESDDGDDDMIEIVPDHDDSEEENMLDSHEEESDLDSDEADESTSDENDQDEEEATPMVTESKVSKENKKLRSQLAETQLLTARSLFVSKLFAEQNLSIGTKQKIVEYIDSAQTVEEAKMKYGRVKKMLQEATKPVRKVTGSSSRPRPLSAPVLNENANSLMKLEMNPNRWQHLAGITKKSV